MVGLPDQGSGGIGCAKYCEPKGVKPAVWHWFAVNAEEERPLFAFPGDAVPGSAEEERRKRRPGGLRLHDDEPNELTQSINHERMPVLISDPVDFETWLSGSVEDAFKLARSYAAEQMRIVQWGPDREDLL
jgi:putative SOS response-associated peptidase YedK